MKAATVEVDVTAKPIKAFQSTPPVKAATWLKVIYFLMFQISIHAAREGGDMRRLQFTAVINIFQSTPPVKAATKAFAISATLNGISIHAAREGGDYYFI